MLGHWVLKIYARALSFENLLKQCLVENMRRAEVLAQKMDEEQAIWIKPDQFQGTESEKGFYFPYPLQILTRKAAKLRRDLATFVVGRGEKTCAGMCQHSHHLVCYLNLEYDRQFYVSLFGTPFSNGLVWPGECSYQRDSFRRFSTSELPHQIDLNYKLD